jgi:hypothetical protein
MRVFWLGSLVTATLVVGGCGGDVVSGNDLPVRCLDEPEPGPCKARALGYFYDYRYDRCRPFHYGGCQAHVPFETLDACQRTCAEGNR